MGSYWSTPEDESQAEADSSLRMDCQAQSLQPKKLRNPRVTILTEILREKAKLDENLVKENNAILKNFLDTFIPEMKKDKLFASLYQHIYFTGSYYSDLRVSKPDEYDLNIVLKLPFKLQGLSVVYHHQVPSYVKYRVINGTEIPKENGLSKFFEDGYLIPSKVRTWLQSVISRAMDTYRPPHNINRVQNSSAGPARTVILLKRQGQIDIDLVPVIQCTLDTKPPGIDGRVHSKVGNKLQCFMVPKPYQPSKQAPINEAERLRLWRAHYPNAEQEIIHNIGCIKPVIKLLKLLRDKFNWKVIASYYLKTVVMWMLIENVSAEYWKLDKLGDRFLDALNVLADCVQRRKIRYFFSSRYNLMEKLSVAEAENIYNKLRAIIRDIERDNNSLWKIFDCKPTF